MEVWFFINDEKNIQFSNSVSRYLTACKKNNQWTCSLQGGINKYYYSSIYYIDLKKMIIYNELDRKTYELFNVKEKDLPKEITKMKDNIGFVPYCNHTPFYTESFYDLIFPDIKDILIPYTCNHTSGCHYRLCKTHNHILTGFNSFEHDYNKIPTLIEKEYLKIYSDDETDLFLKNN